MKPYRTRPGFTLIELLIVIGLLGALVALVLPRLTVQKTWAVDESMAPAEMMEIRRAYAAFQADCLPTALDRTQIDRYGLAILMTTNIAWTTSWSFPLAFEPNRGKGWRGPYLQQEGTRTVYLDEAGQALTGSGPTNEIPVIHDPRHATDDATHAAQHFYRVQMRTNTLYLIYVGADAEFGTGDDVAQPLETP
jgi:prepilin-type N-terminal cleavage/methylation domain-containing protein